MTCHLVLGLLTCCVLLSTVTGRNYSNYKIYRVYLKSPSDFEMVRDLEEEGMLELLSDGHAGHMDALVSPQNEYLCLTRLAELDTKLIKRDIGKQIEEERVLRSAGAKEFTYDAYHELDVIYEHLVTMGTAHSDIATTFDLPGTTHEGRVIKAVRITKDIENSAGEKPLVWIDGGIHAREWVSISTVTYIIDTLLGEQEPDKSEEIAALLEKFQFVIAPCVNPDGYVHSQIDRLWRKNRKPSGCRRGEENWYGGCFYEQCFGADPNRNWGPQDIWNTTGVSSDPCSLVYTGTAPFDQPCTEILKNYLTEQKDKLKLYLSFHSYSQLFLTPVGYDSDFTPPESARHERIGAAVVEAIMARHGTEYKAMKMSELYAASGNSPDWVYKELGLVDSYLVELRDTGDYGHELPADQIVETGQENVDGMLALLANIQLQDD